MLEKENPPCHPQNETGRQNHDGHSVPIVSRLPKVWHNRRIRSHNVVHNVARWGKCSRGWLSGLNVHLLSSDQGEVLAFNMTPCASDPSLKPLAAF
ncbi:hypothetical protein GF339_12550 [candidate division KSB3 bacterium]|uniref:Transposase DDE domain-containing protein n=1 Tax=candidate division KSB3 bacterium TaxID=2044937 RepID=A0A9D5JW75_9BACT|nr:hypothetical protein [candidate division KSB3 bacterium]MBD3325412.1 hypothetical protein [candidate division KSB3 bacterium]